MNRVNTLYVMQQIADLIEQAAVEWPGIRQWMKHQQPDIALRALNVAIALLKRGHSFANEPLCRNLRGLGFPPAYIESTLDFLYEIGAADKGVVPIPANNDAGCYKDYVSQRKTSVYYLKLRRTKSQA